MQQMFSVRSAHALAPSRHRHGLYVQCEHTYIYSVSGQGAGHPPSALYRVPCLTQHASAFNQPLTFNTSSVTVMWGMFAVRSARLLTPPRRPTRLLPSLSTRIVYVLSFRLCRMRRRSISRCTSTLPVSLTWSPCSRCAPPVPSIGAPQSPYTQLDAPPPSLLHALTPPPPHAAASAADHTPSPALPFHSAESVGLRPAPEF
eukprot:scaffold21814_cov65-Phaeocystis_antarctica.AAC.2